MHTLYDIIDLKILEILQHNSRIKRNQISEAIGMSIPSVTDRLHKLESNGIIETYLTKLNPKLLGKDITAFIFITVDSSIHYKDFIAHAIQTPEVLECHSITGDGTHIIKVRTDNTSTLEKLLSKIQSWKGVQSTRTSIVLSTHKEGFYLDLKHYIKSSE